MVSPWLLLHKLNCMCYLNIWRFSTKTRWYSTWPFTISKAFQHSGSPQLQAGITCECYAFANRIIKFDRWHSTGNCCSRIWASLYAYRNEVVVYQISFKRVFLMLCEFCFCLKNAYTLVQRLTIFHYLGMRWLAGLASNKNLVDMQVIDKYAND